MAFRSLLKTCAVQFIFLAALVVIVSAAPSAQDADIVIDPIIHYFPPTALNTDSVVVKEFTVKNLNASTVRTIGTITLSGLHPDQYIQTTNCDGVTLTQNGGSCTVSVKYHPTADGVKSAMLRIPSSDSDTPVLTAFVTTREAVADQAVRRIPPVLAAAAIPETMTNNTTIPLTWSLVGYDTSYTTTVAFFNCTGISNGCGDLYGSNFLAAADLQPVSSQAGEWTYNGVTSRTFNYSYNFAPTGFAVPTDVVIRFYVKSQGDAAAAKGGLSLLIPGDLAVRYYDTAGRRIIKTINP